jgi:multiple sugar transport system substrate-binding protein
MEVTMESRRRFLAKGAGVLAAAAAGPMLLTRSARAAGSLRILQWSHFVPAYDKWFDP